ncbi:hypothetical protein ACA910_018866 [Epithemia clementina (nom. ined.)]
MSAAATAAAAAAASSSSATTAAAVRRVYRELFHMARNMKTEEGQRKALDELRTSFRDTHSTLTMEERLKKAQDRASFLRITMPQHGKRLRGDSTGTWVYRDGQKLENVNGTLRDDKGRVHTNWDGKNLDPCSVKRHYSGLRRAGFANNLHAKGFF